MSHGATISAWIGIIVVAFGIVARFTSLEEAKENNIKWITELSEKEQKQDERLQRLEQSNAMLERVHQLEMRLIVLERDTQDKPRHAR